MTGAHVDVMDTVRLARMLHVPDRMIRLLVDHHLLPEPGRDGWPSPQVRALVARHDWLRLLGTPLSRRELHGLNTTLEMPEDAFSMAGRQYAPLYRIVERAWAGPPPEHHAAWAADPLF